MELLVRAAEQDVMPPLAQRDRLRGREDVYVPLQKAYDESPTSLRRSLISYAAMPAPRVCLP